MLSVGLKSTPVRPLFRQVLLTKCSKNVQIKFSVNFVARKGADADEDADADCDSDFNAAASQTKRQFGVSAAPSRGGHNSHEICKDTRILQRSSWALTLTRNELRCRHRRRLVSTHLQITRNIFCLT